MVRIREIKLRTSNREGVIGDDALFTRGGDPMGIDLDASLREPVEVLRQNTSFFVLPLIPATIDFLSSFTARSRSLWGTLPSVHGLLNFLSFLVEIWVMSGLVYRAERHLEGGFPDYRDGLNAIVERWLDFTIAATIIAVGTFIGLLLLIIPGLLWLMLVAFTLPIMVSKNLNAVGSIKESINLVVEKLWDVFIYLLILVVLVAVVTWILGFIPYIGDPIATILLNPYVAVSITIAYHQIEGE